MKKKKITQTYLRSLTPLDKNEINPIYEVLTKKEKKKIFNELSDDLKEKVFISVTNLLNQLQEYSDQIRFNYNPKEILKLSMYDRYKFSINIHKELMSVKTHNCDYRVSALYFFDEYEHIYNLIKQIIADFKTIHRIIGEIAKSKIGKNDFNTAIHIKKSAMKNSLDNIKSYLLKNKRIHKKVELILNNFFNINESEENRIKNFLEIITKYDLNYLNDDQSKYEIFEQVILAPLKLRQYIKNEKQKKINFENFEGMFEYFKETNPNVHKKVRDFINHNNTILNFKQSEIEPYCLMIFFEFFYLDIFKIKNLYTIFFSDSNSNTRYLEKFLEYIDMDDHNYHELLPWEPNMKEIFYEVSKGITYEEMIMPLKNGQCQYRTGL